MKRETAIKLANLLDKYGKPETVAADGGTAAGRRWHHRLVSWLNRPIPDWLWRREKRGIARDIEHLAERCEIYKLPQATELSRIAETLKGEAS